MAALIAERPPLRPPCPVHAGSRILLDGFTGARWSDRHRRPRYRCVPVPGTKGHSFTLPVAVRQPTSTHPDAGRACPGCDHLYERHEGVRTGRGFVFGHREIARLFIRLGQGASLRGASRELREHVLKRCNRRIDARPFKHIARGDTSRQANLAADYLDAYAPLVLDALLPRCWPSVVIVDATTLMASGYRSSVEADVTAAAGREVERPAGNLKAGTILMALDGSRGDPLPVRLSVRGGKDVDSWRSFLSALDGEPAWVVADLDAAIARAVRETWPRAILYHSRHHIEALMGERAIADGVPERVRLDEPLVSRRPIAWTGATERHWGDHPLFAALRVAQRGPTEWAAFKAAVAEHVDPDRLELRSWIATNEPLIERQWRIVADHGPIPRSTGSLEGKTSEWLAPIRRRAGRWQNARRLELVLGLITLEGRGEAREARYAGLIRGWFERSDNASHPPTDDALPMGNHRGSTRHMSWWRTWQDHDGASLPRLVREADRRSGRRAADEHLAWAKERLQRLYDEATGQRVRLGLPVPPRGRPRNPRTTRRAPVQGRFLREYDDLLLEWDWDLNADLDPLTLRAGSHVVVAWRCLLDPGHVWETRLADRTYGGSSCPFHMGDRVHPSGSLAAYYPELAKQWHPSRNDRRPDEVTRASGYAAHWRCAHGHEWRAVVYQRTLSMTGCPVCQRLGQPDKARAAIARRRLAADARTEAQLALLSASDHGDRVAR